MCKALGNRTAGLSELRIPIFSKGIYDPPATNTFFQFGLNITPAEAQDTKKKAWHLYLISMEQVSPTLP